jgi:FkbM family methyltransferase
MRAETEANAPDKKEGAPGLGFGPRYFRQLAPDIGTVIDVGVFKGTQALYDAFPNTPFILIDPLQGCEAMLEKPPKRYTFVPKALGSAPGKLTLNIQGAKSSMMERTPLSRKAGPKGSYEVEVTTLDAVIEELNPVRPLGMKIDTEGFEVEVIKGLNKYAADFSFIICETTVRRRFYGSYVFSDLVCLMKSKGFEFYTIMNRPKKRPRFYDVLFLPPSHPYFD